MVVSGLVQLLEPAIVGSAIRPRACEPRRLPQPSAAVQRGIGHLTDKRRRDRAPGRDRGVLPARRNRALLWACRS